MKKLIALLMAAAMIVCVLAGCGSTQAPAATQAPAPAATEAPAQTEAVPAEAEAPAAEPVTLRIAYMPNWGALWAVSTAQAKGYFAEENITLELIPFEDGPTEIAAMESGNIDISYIGPGAHKLCSTGNAKVLLLQHLGDGDCGCGTGILGIAASKLGAKEIIGYDIDEWSTHNATHNASINNVTNMQVMLGDASILKEVKEKFDVVLANINRNILLSDMPVFASLMTIGSTLIISGFYSSDVPLLEEKAAELGMEITGIRTDNEWTCLTLNKKK